MPLHLNSITDKDIAPQVLAWLVQNGMKECDAVFLDKTRRYVHLRRNITDTLSGRVIGKICYTLKNTDKMLEILDLDITMDNEVPTLLQFNKRMDTSSDSNEYYEAETADDHVHLEIETVNRHVVDGDLVGTVREVYISAFPFALSIYADIDDFNQRMGFTRPVSVGKTDLSVFGFSDKFMMPGSALSLEDTEESYSFVVGRVVSFRDVEISFGEVKLAFVLARVDTALGIIPVVMGREVFDIAQLREGSVVGMKADIKVDLAKDENFMQRRGE